MILRQFLHEDPVAASYFFGCGGHAVVAVEDSLGDIEPYRHLAAKTGTRIRYVIDTHLHTDHQSCGRALAESEGAEYVLFAGAEVTFPFRKVRDCDVLELGDVLAEVLHTPGHTREHISLLVTDKTRSPEPWFLLSGHTLMVGDLGRTELAASAAESARALFQSVQRMKTLPEIFPGAYAGSVCGRGLSGKPNSTIGFEKRHNAAFKVGDENTFLRLMLADIPPPPRAAEFRAFNAGLATD